MRITLLLPGLCTRGLFVVLGLLSGLAMGAPAVAADASAGTTADQNPALEEVVVTARRREENVQTVPIAIDVVTPQLLQQNNIQTIGDLQYLVPSMSASNFATRDAVNVSIRGQGTNGPSGEPGVVVYINEVPVPVDREGDLAGGPGLMFDLENVQVLKGPQGTLFGQNSVGGALLMQTARPTKEFGGNIQASYGNYDDRELDGAINIPLSDTLLTRIAFTGQLRDGFTHLLSDPSHPNGTDADNRDDFGLRGTVTYRPNETFQNDTIVTFTQFESHGSPLLLTNVNTSATGCSGAPCPAPTFFPTLAPSLAQQQALGIRTVIPVSSNEASSGSNLSINNITRIALSDALTFRNIFGFEDYYQVLALDIDGTSLPILDFPDLPRDDTYHQFTDEAQLLGKTMAGRLEWIVGAFFLDNQAPKFNVEDNIEFGAPADSGTKPRTRSEALFAQGTYDLSEVVKKLKFTAGLRYSWDDLSALGGPAPPGDLQPTGPFQYSDAKSSALTWTGGLEYQATAETLLYLTSRRGFRPGGANGFSASGLLENNYGPEYVNDLELGLKSDWSLGGVPVRTNIDLYGQTYDDIQVQQIVFASNGSNFAALTENAATARQWGAEFEVHAQLTDDLQVGGTFDYLSFKYTKFAAGVDAATLTEGQYGNRPPRKYGVNARYHLPFDGAIGALSVRANWNWQADSVAVPSGTVIPAFGLLNLSADWDGIHGTGFDVSLFATNVLNKDYSVGGFNELSSLGFAIQRFGEPRMYGVRLRYWFGVK